MIKYLVVDVDGTLTDGKIYIGSEGEALKAFNIKDGYGLKNICLANKITPIIITGRTSNIVKMRCDELEIEHCYQGVSDKLVELKRIITDIDKTAIIGDDIPDLECMQAIKKAGGIVGCTADAVKEVKEIADFISSKNGGDGAVREFIEHIISL